MSLSKLDKYLNVLGALVDRPLKVDQIARVTHIEPEVLKDHLAFLLACGVIEEQMHARVQVFYAITERGLAVFKTLRVLTYLDKLWDSLPVVEEAREVISNLVKRR